MLIIFFVGIFLMSRSRVLPLQWHRLTYSIYREDDNMTKTYYINKMCLKNVAEYWPTLFIVLIRRRIKEIVNLIRNKDVKWAEKKRRAKWSKTWYTVCEWNKMIRDNRNKMKIIHIFYSNSNWLRVNRCCEETQKYSVHINDGSKGIGIFFSKLAGDLSHIFRDHFYIFGDHSIFWRKKNPKNNYPIKQNICHLFLLFHLLEKEVNNKQQTFVSSHSFRTHPNWLYNLVTCNHVKIKYRHVRRKCIYAPAPLSNNLNLEANYNL